MSSIVITGANRGIGFHFVERCLSRGNNVAVLDVETDNLENLAQSYPDRLLFFKADVRDFDQMRAAIEAVESRFGRIDIAIHNAYLCPFSKETELELGAYESVFDVNYFGALRLVKCTVPHMRARGGGRIVFVSSGVGVTGFPGLSAYASTKGALETLAKCLSLEYASVGISFHIIHPPLTRTRSSAPLPVPKEFMADPLTVGRGLADRIGSKHFILCHSRLQKLQILLCYLFPIRFGKLLSSLTQKCTK